MCGSRKYPYPRQGGLLENTRRGVYNIDEMFKDERTKIRIPRGIGGSPTVEGVQ